MSRLDDLLAEQERCAMVARYLRRKRQEREAVATCIATWIVLVLSMLAWLTGTALIAWVLSFTVGRLAFWQWCLVIFVAGIAAGRVASWFKRGEAER